MRLVNTATSKGMPTVRPWSSAWLETSVTSSVAPRCALGHQLEKIARLRRGVQRGAHFSGDVIFDGADENSGAGGGVEQRFGEKGVVVLPLVPVMPVAASLRSGWPKNAAEASARARRPCSTSSTGRPALIDEQMVEGLRRVSDDAERARGEALST